MNTITVTRPARVQAPRGAVWAARAALALSRAIARWAAPRAPAPIDDAARVRALAYQYLNSDPSFAADLFAAADRYEVTRDRQ